MGVCKRQREGGASQKFGAAGVLFFPHGAKPPCYGCEALRAGDVSPEGALYA